MPDLPPPSADLLRKTHAQGGTLLRKARYRPESVNTALLVEKHRWYWRPERIRVLLVAESHVFTSDRDSRLRLNMARIRKFLRAGASPPPDGFVRLVYCLAYGESELLQSPPQGFHNPGTRNFWDIFGRVTDRLPQPPEGEGAAFIQRMNWRIANLRKMYKRGIWLLDASVHAMYLGKGDHIPLGLQNDLHRQWWEGYGRHVVESCGRTKVWVIGSTVYRALEHLPGWRCDGWVYQPTASRVDPDLNWPGLLDDCL